MSTTKSPGAVATGAPDSDQLGGKVVWKTKPPPNFTQACVNATLVGSDHCSALGITGRGSAPVLSLCRKLIDAGHDPRMPLRVWRAGSLTSAQSAKLPTWKRRPAASVLCTVQTFEGAHRSRKSKICDLGGRRREPAGADDFCEAQRAMAKAASAGQETICRRSPPLHSYFNAHELKTERRGMACIWHAREGNRNVSAVGRQPCQICRAVRPS